MTDTELIDNLEAFLTECGELDDVFVCADGLSGPSGDGTWTGRQLIHEMRIKSKDGLMFLSDARESMRTLEEKKDKFVDPG